MPLYNLKIGTLNCRGLNQPIKTKRMVSYLKQNNLNIICIQETHLKVGKILQQASKLYPEQFLSSGTSKSRGTAILISEKN